MPNEGLASIESLTSNTDYEQWQIKEIRCDKRLDQQSAQLSSLYTDVQWSAMIVGILCFKS